MTKSEEAQVLTYEEFRKGMPSFYGFSRFPGGGRCPGCGGARPICGGANPVPAVACARCGGGVSDPETGEAGLILEKVGLRVFVSRAGEDGGGMAWIATAAGVVQRPGGIAIRFPEVAELARMAAAVAVWNEKPGRPAASLLRGVAVKLRGGHFGSVAELVHAMKRHVDAWQHDELVDRLCRVGVVASAERPAAGEPEGSRADVSKDDLFRAQAAKPAEPRRWAAKGYAELLAGLSGAGMNVLLRPDGTWIAWKAATGSVVEPFEALTLPELASQVFRALVGEDARLEVLADEPDELGELLMRLDEPSGRRLPPPAVEVEDGPERSARPRRPDVDVRVCNVHPDEHAEHVRRFAVEGWDLVGVSGRRLYYVHVRERS